MQVEVLSVKKGTNGGDFRGVFQSAGIHSLGTSTVHVIVRVTGGTFNILLLGLALEFSLMQAHCVFSALVLNLNVSMNYLESYRNIAFWSLFLAIHRQQVGAGSKISHF
jgi:hypothetical protein